MTGLLCEQPRGPADFRGDVAHPSRFLPRVRFRGPSRTAITWPEVSCLLSRLGGPWLEPSALGGAVTTIDELTDSVGEVLEPHAMFFNAGRDDDTRYYVGPEVIEFLSLLLTSVVLPVLSNVLSDRIKQGLGDRAKHRSDAQKRKDAVREAAAVASQGPAPSAEALAAASAAATQVLSNYGWTAKAAEADGDLVVTQVVTTIWRK